jgi:hypothetical protein
MVGPGSAAEERWRWQRNAFPREQLGLDAEKPSAISRPAAAVAAQGAVACDDPVTWDDQPNGIAANRASNGSRGTGATHHARHPAVAGDLSIWDPPHGAEDAPIPIRQTHEIDGEVERASGAPEVSPQLVDGRFKKLALFARASGARGLRCTSHPTLETCHEGVGQGEQFEGNQPGIGCRKVDRSPGSRNKGVESRGMDRAV